MRKPHWVQTFTSEFIDSARPARHTTGDRWFVDETYVKVAGRWTYLYRAIDQHGQVIDVLVSERSRASTLPRSINPTAPARELSALRDTDPVGALPRCATRPRRPHGCDRIVGVIARR